MEIQPVGKVGATAPSPQLKPQSSSSQSADFGQTLMNVLKGTNNELRAADQALVDFSNGQSDDIQDVVMSAAKADLSFRFFLEMRNKLTESYQELSRMQF